MDSKRPNAELIYSLIEGDPRARAIMESWKARLPVVVMPCDQFDALVRDRKVCFDFALTDDPEDGFPLEIGKQCD